ncbi:TPA: HAD family hydrolase [Photobacterium damselae]
MTTLDYMVQGKKIACFDLCGTLVKENTTVEFVKKYRMTAYERKFYNSFLFKIFNKILKKILLIDFYRIILIRKLKGLERSTLYSMANDFVDDCLGNEDVHKVLKECRDNKWDIYIVSASLDFIVEAFALKYGIKNCFYTKLSYIDGVCQGKIEEDLLDRKENIKLPQHDWSLFVSDNVGDKEVMLKSTFAIAVIYNEKKWKGWGRDKICY